MHILSSNSFDQVACWMVGDIAMGTDVLERAYCHSDWPY